MACQGKSRKGKHRVVICFPVQAAHEVQRAIFINSIINGRLGTSRKLRHLWAFSEEAVEAMAAQPPVARPLKHNFQHV